MSTISTPRPRNAALNKDQARVQYAARRLQELKAKGINEAEAWNTIQAELKAGKS